MKGRLPLRCAVPLLFLLLLFLLASCGMGAPESTTVTYASVTTNAAGEEPPLSDDELAAFLSLVDRQKVSRAQLCYFNYYVGEYRSVEECEDEILESIRTMQGIRTVTDVDGATGVYINLYARLQGDNYGYYYPPQDYSDYTEDISGEYVGIGVSVTLDDGGYAEILTVFSSSPAEEAGLLPGDRIVAVEGEDFALIGYQNAIDRIRGEAGTTVSLTVEREGVRSTLSVVRRRVTEETVTYRLMDGDIGYIRITSFDDRTYEQFVAAHRALDGQGAASYVFDVRGNPGGTLTSVVAILEYILPDGDIVHLNYKNDGDDQTIDSIRDLDPYGRYMDGQTRVYYEGHSITAPMVVLANGRTASAGELFTSSLDDYGVATVVGEETFGKGVGQTSLTLGQDGSALVFTVFYYDPPTSPNYDGVGITPDVPSSLSEAAAGKNLYKLTYEEDTQLQAAVGILLGAQ